MKINYKSLIFLSLLILSSCNIKTKESEKSNYNKEETYIIPKEYQKTGEGYSVFIYNETDEDISSKRGIVIKSKKYHIYQLVDTDSIILNGKIKFFFGETEGLEVQDKLNQVSGLGGSYLKQYNVPDFVDWAFTIVNDGTGDE